MTKATVKIRNRPERVLRNLPLLIAKTGSILPAKLSSGIEAKGWRLGNQSLHPAHNPLDHRISKEFGREIGPR
ncbi:MAG: hypothetical protein K9G43_06925, partial [Rhodobacteraceae bacterium]|nr:hypothetical protein [Paracoccaceae bacterium]